MNNQHTFSIAFSVIHKHSQRLDIFASTLPLPISMNRSQLKKYCINIMVNNKKVQFSYKISYKDYIILTFFTDIKEQNIIQQKSDSNALLPPIIYEDKYTLILNKPQGQVVHAGINAYKGTVAHAIFHKLHDYTKEEYENHRAGIVHRIDKHTSGLLVIAKTKDSHIYYSEEFKKRKVVKNYLSIVKGSPKYSQKVIETYIVRNQKKRTSFMVHLSKGKWAKSEYIVLYSNNLYSVLKWNIYTGRTHQIRVHAKYILCPILGDPLYSRMNKKEKETLSLCLHSWKLDIKLYKGKNKQFIAPIPKDMKTIFIKIGFSSFKI